MSIELLRKLGIYIDTNFLSANLCDEICHCMADASKSMSPVYSESNNSNNMNIELRKSYYANISEQYQKTIEEKIKLLQPTIEQHYSEKYHPQIIETPKFALYGKGHYFGPHRDNQLNRKINISLYLNDEKTIANIDGYTGGQLILYELFANPKLAQKGIALTGKKGMLVAYPANISHEITPVIDGTRYAVIARYLAEKNK